MNVGARVRLRRSWMGLSEGTEGEVIELIGASPRVRFIVDGVPMDAHTLTEPEAAELLEVIG